MPELLTEAVVKALVPPAKGAVTVWDAEVRGFGVRVFSATKRNDQGGRSFFLNYRVDGVERRITIGAFPSWTAKAARAEAKVLRQRVDRGDDPASDRKTRREAPTVRELADRYKAEHLPRKAARSQKEDWRILEKEVLPRLGDRKVSEIHHGDITSLHRAITDRGAPVRANRVLATTSKMFSLALKPAAGEIGAWRNQEQGNPCRGVERNPEEGSERFFSSAEIAALSDALKAHGATPAADCLRLIMLTGCRPGEAMQATWEQFDVEPGIWVKPSAHTKQRKVHRVPLGPPAILFLEGVRAQKQKTKRAKSSPYVFPGQKEGQPMKRLASMWTWITDHGSVALWASSAKPEIAALVRELETGLKRRPTARECQQEAARRKVEIGPGLLETRIYDLRHTFASVGAGGGLSLEIVGRLLGHTQHRTTMRYAHLADDPLRDAVTRISNVIQGAGMPGASLHKLKA